MNRIRLRDEQKGAILLGIIILIIAVVSVVMAVSLKEDNVAEMLSDDQVVRVLNILEDDDGSVIFTNVLIYYPVSEKAAAVNIPGNTAAIFQSLGRVDRIDQVYKEKGCDVYRNEIEKLLACKIPFYMSMKFSDFIKITDMLGGMRVFIPAPVDSVSSDGERWLLPSGAVTLDGDKISTYIKYRNEDETDSDVQERYQNVVSAFYSMLHDRKNVLFAKKNNFKQLKKFINFNLKDEDSRRLLFQISNMDSETIARQTVTGRIRIMDDQRLMFPLNNGEFIKEAVKQSTNMLISNSGTYASRVYVLEIKNGTTVQGLAHKCKIPFYMSMKFSDFIKITDMLGGMRVFIPAPVDSVSSDGERWLLPSGAVTLDGDKISTYIKYRNEDETDSDVQERYQNVVSAFYSMLHDRKNVLFAKKNNFKQLKKFINFNLKDEDSRRLLFQISNMDSETIARQTVTGRIRIMDDQRLMFPLNNGEFIKEAVKQSTNMLISNSGTYASRVYVLEIKNGTTVQGLAHNTSILFQNASYDVLSAVNADRNDYERTVIIDHIGNKEIASMVGNFIHCTNIQEEEVDLSHSESDTSADVDFTIILGKDFDGRYVRASRNE